MHLISFHEPNMKAYVSSDLGQETAALNWIVWIRSANIYRVVHDHRVPSAAVCILHDSTAFNRIQPVGPVWPLEHSVFQIRGCTLGIPLIFLMIRVPSLVLFSVVKPGRMHSWQIQCVVARKLLSPWHPSTHTHRHICICINMYEI